MFEWEVFRTGFGESLLDAPVELSTDGDNRVVTDFSPADVNGDGRMDLVWQESKYEGDYGTEITNTEYRLLLGDETGFKSSPKTLVFNTGDDTRHPWMTQVVDYNADGRSDVLYYNGVDDVWYVHLAEPVEAVDLWTISESRHSTGVSEEEARFVDLNSDGLIDVLTASYYRLMERDLDASVTSNLYYRLGTPIDLSIQGMENWSPSTRGINDMAQGVTHHTYISPDAFGDFNGDGRMDVVVIDTEVKWEDKSLNICQECYEVTSQRSKFYVATFQGPEDSSELVVMTKPLTFTQDSEFDDAALKSGTSTIRLRHLDLHNSLKAQDINGDGISDLVLEYEKHEHLPSAIVAQALEQGIVEEGDSPGDEQLASEDDYDIYTYRLGHGRGFHDEVFFRQISDEVSVQFIDINYDGGLDAVWPIRQGYLAADIWGGTEFNDYRYIADISRYEEFDSHILVDMTGDGRLDYLHFFDEQVDLRPATNDGEPLNVVKRIVNGLGSSTDIQYGTMADSPHYTRLDLTYDVVEQCEMHNRYGYPYMEICNDIPIPDVGAFYDRLNSPWDYQTHWPLDGVDPAPGQDLAKHYPVLEVMAPLQVVERASSIAPAVDETGVMNFYAQSAVSYYYHQQQMQAAGRGNLGFNRIASFDEQSNVQTTTYYRQDYPFIGFPLNTKVEHIDPSTSAVTLISESANIWAQADRSASAIAPQDSLQTYIQSSVEISYNIDAGFEQEKQRVTTSNNPPDEFGNHTSVVITSEGNGDILTKTTTAEYGETGDTLSFDNTDRTVRSYPALGRLVSSTVTHHRTGEQYSGEDIARTSSFTYYGSGKQAGLLHEEFVAPGHVLETGETPLRNTTTYTYDELGNQIQVTVSGADVDRVTQLSRTTKVEFEPGGGRYPDKNISLVTVFDADGDNPEVVELVTEEVLSRDAYGNPLEVRDINGNIAEFAYTPFGYRYLQYSPTGVTQTSYREAAGEHCPVGTSFQERKETTGGVASLECFDLLGRRLRAGSQTFDGDWAFVDTKYDNLGRAVATSLPFAGGAEADYWSEIDYDDFGRVTATRAPDDSAPGGFATTTISYSGFTTVTTNPLAQPKTEVHNAYGELLSTTQTDALTLDTTVEYFYNSQGNLTTTRINGDTATDVVIEYDIVGRKKRMIDPDKGEWRYAYNAFGELRRQTDAKSQEIETIYDDLGRIVGRLDKADRYASPTSDTVWLYNNGNLGATGIGALYREEDKISGFARDYTYDEWGRADEVTTYLPEADGSVSAHYQKTTYDEYGRVYKLFDAGGDNSWSDSVALHTYNELGFLLSVSDAVTINGIARNEPYYEVEAMDIRGNITQEKHGGRYTTTKIYYPISGRIESIKTDTSGSVLDPFVFQSESYVWDEIGNLISRTNDTDTQNTLEESFIYDDLNRLTQATINGDVTNVTYDALGNITYKSDVGDYKYGSQCEAGTTSGPHAVCGLSDGTVFNYDNNGNMLGDGERSFNYSIFDKVTSINKGATNVSFAYGSDRSRYQRTDSHNGVNKTTQYIGNVEKIVSQEDGIHVTEVKRYIGNTLISKVLNADGEIIEHTTQFMLKDHLGSVRRVLDYDEVSVNDLTAQSFSFDPWGQRRDARDWSRFDTFELADFDSSITTRGFTGHEMVDSVGIIHMNGRIYDPRLGRFLQADPFVDGVENGQGFNRYSYLHNNPLNGTDPTGF